MREEGWYVDPFGAHEARWFSDGEPTALVRDAEEESHDDPPNVPFPSSLVPIDASASAGPEDLHRAGAADETYDPETGKRAVVDFFVQLPKK
jgi:hypothetical protein